MAWSDHHRIPFSRGASVIKKRFDLLKPHLDERLSRLVVAAEARALGHGGITAVSRATGLSRNTVARGMEELERSPDLPAQRIRRRGGGRKREVEKDPALIRDLEYLMEPLLHGEASFSLQWTCKSLRRLADELKAKGHTTSHRMVGELLHHMGYRFHAQQPSPAGLSRPKRNEWFERIHQRIEEFHRHSLPVISVEMKKREHADPDRAHHSGLLFQDVPQESAPALIEAPEIPNGYRDIPVHDDGSSVWIPVGVDHSTCAIAVESIRRWWMSMGSLLYPQADALLMIADGAGDSRYRSVPWKDKLQRFAVEAELSLTVLWFPTGMCKWNRIQNRYVSCARQEWPQGPCIEHEILVNVIAGMEPPVESEESLSPAGSPIQPNEGNRSRNGTNTVFSRDEDEYGSWGFTLTPFPQKTHKLFSYI